MHCGSHHGPLPITCVVEEIMAGVTRSRAVCHCRCHWETETLINHKRTRTMQQGINKTKMENQGEELTVAEEVQGWLRIMSDGSVDRQPPADLDPAILSLMTPVPPTNSAFDRGVATRDVVINKEKPLSCRIYFPEKAKDTPPSATPVILHFKGGGFCISHADWRMYYDFYARFVRESGMICVSVDYRLAPEHKLPAACEDSFEALQWLASVARGETHDEWLSKYADFSKCALLGDSVGGNLVHDVFRRAQAKNNNLIPLQLRCGVMINPGYVGPEKTQSELTAEADPMLSVEMADALLCMSAPEGVEGRCHAITNPMKKGAVPLPHLSFPPLLVGVATMDPLYDGEIEYVEVMKEAGHEVELFVSENVGHSFYLNGIAVQMDPDIAKKTTDILHRVLEFIGSKFG